MILKNLSLPISGNKAELIGRICEAEHERNNDEMERVKVSEILLSNHLRFIRIFVFIFVQILLCTLCQMGMNHGYARFTSLQSESNSLEKLSNEGSYGHDDAEWIERLVFEAVQAEVEIDGNMGRASSRELGR